MNLKKYLQDIIESKIALLLIIITIFAAILRFYHLGWSSLWLDEAATVEYSSGGFMMAWNYFSSGEYNPPLFYWITGVMLNFGNSEFILRLIPALCGVVAVPLTFLLGKEWHSEKTGIVAAALLAFSPFALYYSQEARTYSIAVVFAILLMIFYIRTIKTNNTQSPRAIWFNWIMVSVFAALGVWAHLYFAILVVTVFLHSLITNYKPIKSLAKPLVSIVVFIWLALPIILVTIFGLWSRRTAGAPTFGIRGLSVITDLFWSFGSYLEWASIIVFILMIGGIYLTYLEDKKNKTDMVLLSLMFIIVPLVISVPLSYKIPMVSRYMLYLLPFVLVLVAQPLLYLKDTRIQTLFVIGMITLGAPTLYTYTSQYVKDDWRGYANHLTEITTSGDIVITVPGYMNLPLKYYYNNSTDKTILLGASNVSDIVAVTDGNKNVWYVLTPDIGAADPSGKTEQWLKENTIQIEQWKYYIYTLRYKAGKMD